MHCSRRIERLRKLFVATALSGVLLGAAPQPVQLDSQLVVSRYLTALARVSSPPFVVFSYRVSQAGARNIEQIHRIFRARRRERDETVSMEGDRAKIVRVLPVSDRYAIARVAPRTSAYTFLFLEAKRRGKHLDYVYATEPLMASAFTVTQVTIDGDNYLPSFIAFRSVAASVRATGTISYTKVGRYWLPIAATASAQLLGHPTREQITWSGYSFPSSLPPSTFIQPKTLSVPAISPPTVPP